MKHKFLFSFLILFCASIKIFAQSPLIQHFTTSEGLPSNEVYTVFQDSKKFIWFATDAGVSRYDGSKFNYYRKQDGLSSNDIFDIKEDSFGRIWFFHTNAALNFYYNNSIHNKSNTPFLDSLKSNDSFRQLYEDKEHTLYFYFNSQRLIYSLDSNNHVTRYKLPSTLVQNHFIPRTIEAMSIRYMNRNPNGEFIFWTQAGCYTTKQLSKRPYVLNNAFRFREVFTSSDNRKYILVRDKDKTKFELKRFNQEMLFDKIAPLDSTGSEYISSIFEDENGILWISTYDKGVFCFREGKIVYHFDIKDAKSIIQDHEKNIWICSAKEGVYKISPFFDRHQHFERSLFQNSGIFALCPYNDQSIWCTNGKLVYRLADTVFYKLDFQKTEKSFNQLLQVNPTTLLVGETNKLPYALEEIRTNQADKTIYAGKVTQSRIVMKKFIYNKQKNEISSHNLSFVFLIQQDKIFKKMNAKRIGERISNIFYNTNNELIINARKNYLYQDKNITDFNELSFFNDKTISDHLNINDSTELFNIEGDSLFLWNKKQLFNLTSNFEQPIDLQIKHLAYHDSTLFIATSRNIYLCKNPLNILQKKSVLLNLIDINFNSIHGILFNNKKLYIASDDGLTSIPFSELNNSSVSSPLPYFQSIQVNDQENLVQQDLISFRTSQRINITFGCINYSVSPNIYSYRLKGSDSNWTVVKGNNVVLQNLAKGKYYFELRVRKPASSWSKPIQFGITVHATIWQHPLFYFVLALLIGMIAFYIVLKQKNAELARRQMEHQILLLEQKSHQAMMNPHFIFNVLGSIQNYLLRNKPHEAGIFLSQFARLIRQNLNALNTSMINLEEEIERLKDYLDLEKLRMGDKFDYFIAVDETVDSEDILIPSMIVQPFVENSIWHGIANLDNKGQINISFQQMGEKSLQITVEDTGIGLKNAEKYSSRSDQHLKLGMNITKKRLNLLSQKYDTATSIIYSELYPDTTNPGTKVVIIVPFFLDKSELSN